MDALSKRFHNAQIEGEICGIRASQNRPHINNLFFIDDALLFVRNRDREASITMHILRDFEHVSGQKSMF